VAVVALVLYAAALAVGVAAVWRRPVAAVYAFVVGLALHNAVMAVLYGIGVRGAPLTVIQAWKEVSACPCTGRFFRGWSRSGSSSSQP
jgi:hypothetical protein